MKITLGLRSEIVISIALLMVVAIVMIGIVVWKVAEQQMVQHHAKAGLLLMEVLKAGAKGAYPGSGPTGRQNSGAELRRLTEAMGGREGINRVFFVDPEGVVVADTRAEFIGARYEDREIIKALRNAETSVRWIRTGGILTSWDQSEMVITGPLLSPGGSVIGGIRLRLSLKDIGKGIYRFQKVILLYLLMDSLLLVLFGSYLIFKRVVKPLRALVGATESIAEGRLEVRLPDSPANEIGKLSAAFNRMSERLLESRRRLEENLQNLEQANRALREAQEAIIRTEKMASLGRLSAGMAHEIGNPIGSILGYIEMLVKGDLTEEERDDFLNRIKAETLRIRRILRQLTDFSRPSPGLVEEVDLNQVIRECVDLLGARKELQDLRIDLRLSETIPRIKVDKDHIHQVMVNLMLNASDAMEAGGTLTIETAEALMREESSSWENPPHRRDDPPEADYSPMRRTPPSFRRYSAADKGVRITVRDTGHGIAQKDLPNIFEPFYSTKEPGKGTGLGLAVCLGIVESYGGRLRVESRLHQGTEFTILFPVETQQPSVGGSSLSRSSR